MTGFNQEGKDTQACGVAQFFKGVCGVYDLHIFMITNTCSLNNKPIPA